MKETCNLCKGLGIITEVDDFNTVISNICYNCDGVGFFTRRRKEIICPYCGYEFGNSWEYNDDHEKTIECYSCEKEFDLYIDFDIRYTTRKLKEI